MDLSQELETQGVEQQTSSIDSSNDSVAGDTVPEINESGTPVNTDIAISKNAEASEEVKETNQESTEFDESKENVEETKQEVTEPVDNVEQEDEEKSQFSVSKVIEYIADSPSNNSEEKISIVEQSSQTGSVNNPEVIDFCESGTDNSMSPVTGKTDSEDLAKNLSDDSSNNLEIGDTVPEINESGTPVNTDIATSTNAEASEEVKETNQEPTEFDESKENVEETKQEVTELVDLTDNLEGTDSKESATYSTTSEGGEQPQSSSQVLSDDSSNDSSENNTQPVNEPKENVTEETSLEVIASVDSEETDSKKSETDEATTSEDKEHLKVDSKDLSDDSIIGIEGKDQSSSDSVDNNVTQSPEEEQELADTADPFAHLNNIRPLIEAEMDSEESGTDETTTSESEEQPQDDQQQTLIEDFSANSMVKETTQPVESIKDVEESRADEQRDNEAYSSSLLDTSKDIESVIDSSDDTPNDDQGTPANVDSDSAKETDSKESETNETTTSKGGEQPQDDTQNLSDDSISDSAGNNTQPIDEPKENVAQPKQEEKGFADHIDSAGREIQPDKVEISDKLKAKKEVRNEDGSIPIEVKHIPKTKDEKTTKVINSFHVRRKISREVVSLETETEQLKLKKISISSKCDYD